MLNPSDILKNNREAVMRIIASHRGSNPRVFGCVMSGTDTLQSDIDILVDVPPATGLLALGSRQFELEESLGIPVDVLTPGDLPARFRYSVLRKARPL